MTTTRILAAVAAVYVAGCATPTMPYQADKMSPEQLKAMIADKSAAAACSKVVGPWGTGTVVSVNLDRGTMPTGTTVEIGADCVTKIGGTAR